jgi:hypothetical protein
MSDLPEDHILRVAHDQSIYHRHAIESSQICGCFFCLKMFRPDEIQRWTDRREPLPKQTALCPYCGIDSVIGDASGIEITEAFLDEMNMHWFEGTRPNK